MKKYEKEFYKVLLIMILYFAFVSVLIHVNSSDFDAISNTINIFFLLAFLLRGYYLIKYGGSSGPSDYDEVTRLHSISYFRKKLQEFIVEDKISEESKDMVLAIVKLDKFKEINDKFGYEVGDKVLKEFADRLLSKAGFDTIVARGNGSEYYMLFSAKRDVIKRFFLNNISHFTKNITADENDIPIKTSIGISGGETRASNMIKEAELALYEAKNLGGNKFVIYNEELKRKSEERTDIIDGLGSAISGDEFDIFFQPKVDTLNNNIYGVESLIRWNRKDKKNFSPATFIPIAEESGQIKKIGAYVFIRACELIKDSSKINPDLNIAINVSPIQLRDPNFLSFIEKTINKHNIDPKHIELEITEGVFIGDDQSSIEIIKKIKELGLKVSIDDFGTGYSSFSYLKNIDIDCIKIDKVFIDDIESSEKAKSLVKGMINMAHSLSCKVVAEGVENQEQQDFLQEAGCDYIQGYYFSKPLSKSDLLRKLKGQ